jgi:hypothetical protein
VTVNPEDLSPSCPFRGHTLDELLRWLHWKELTTTATQGPGDKFTAAASSTTSSEFLDKAWLGRIDDDDDDDDDDVNHDNNGGSDGRDGGGGGGSGGGRGANAFDPLKELTPKQVRKMKRGMGGRDFYF